MEGESLCSVYNSVVNPFFNIAHSHFYYVLADDTQDYIMHHI